MQPLTPSLLTASSTNSHRTGTVFTQGRTEATTCRQNHTCWYWPEYFSQLVLFPRDLMPLNTPSYLISQHSTSMSSNSEKPQMRWVLPARIALRCDMSYSHPSLFLIQILLFILLRGSDYPNFSKFYLITCPSLQMYAMFLEKAFGQKCLPSLYLLGHTHSLPCLFIILYSEGQCEKWHKLSLPKMAWS